MSHNFIVKVLRHKSVNRTDYWYRGNDDVHKRGLHFDFFSSAGDLNLKARRAATFLRGNKKDNEFTDELIVCPRDGLTLFESCGADNETRHRRVVVATHTAMRGLLTQAHLNAADHRWVAAWQITRKRAWLIVLLAQLSNDVRHPRKTTFPKKLFEAERNSAVENYQESPMAKIFRAAFEILEN